MRLLLMGTGAADGIPSFGCDNELNRLALRQGGKDVRSRTAALIDEELKIDLGPDTLMQCHRNRVDPTEWTGLAFTHSHEDHLCPSEFQYFLYPFNDRDRLRGTVYGNAEVCRILHERYAEWPIEFHETKSFECYTHASYAITPIRANHKHDEDCQNLLVQKQGAALLYATDTGIWDEETWEFLKDYRLNLFVIECTEGFRDTDYWGHLDIKECIQVVDRLRNQGTLLKDAKVVTTHHSVRGDASHAQLEDALGPHGIAPGFDGMCLEV